MIKEATYQRVLSSRAFFTHAASAAAHPSLEGPAAHVDMDLSRERVAVDVNVLIISHRRPS
jgi:hypothetical protein